MRSGVWVPLFDALSDPLAVARLAARAEEAGWHGFFVWDHVNWRPPISSVADPWVTLAAIATATEALTSGPMVTPLGRRRPSRWPGRPRHSIGSAGAGWCWGPASGMTASATSSARLAMNSTVGFAARCSTRRWRS